MAKLFQCDRGINEDALLFHILPDNRHSERDEAMALRLFASSGFFREYS